MAMICVSHWLCHLLGNSMCWYTYMSLSGTAADKCVIVSLWNEEPDLLMVITIGGEQEFSLLFSEKLKWLERDKIGSAEKQQELYNTTCLKLSLIHI